MKNSKFWLHVFWGFALLIFPETLFCQTNTGDNSYEPELGQAGKDVIWYPTPHKLVDVMINMADLTSNDYLIDLGSGDGRIVIAAAKKGINATGVEFNQDMVEYSKKYAEREGVADKTDFVKADFFEYDMSKATVITMFLLPEINRQLKPKLLELRPGTRIITNSFSMQDWPYDEIGEIDDQTVSWNTAFMWIVPAKVEGSWKFKDGEMHLTQNYQMLKGNMKTGGESYSIDGKLCGSVLKFTCNGVNYECTVNNNEMKGTAEKEGKSTVWEAVKTQ
ncbi:MAG: class I SAM-dependent methyltransferase [Bacteroidales bacterium]|nr:class I SAM-dependent methyltransferase [Bacteroidales bacterium]